MKLSSIRYLIGEGFKNVWVHRFMSLASVGVLLACMVMMGVAILLSVNVDTALGSLQDQNAIVVFYSDEMTDEQAQIVTTTIADMDNVKDAVFISKAEGLERQKEVLGSDYAALLDYLEDDNPLPNAAQVTFEDLEQFDSTVLAIEKVQGVTHINEQRDIAAKLNSIRSMINNAGFWIVALLFVISVAIVANTIRITMFSRKREINIMKAVGATDSFIRVPFMIEGMLLGIISGAISTGLLYFIYKASTASIEKSFGMTVVPFSDFAIKMLLGFMLMGAVTGVIASLISMSKYLRHEGSEFNAIT
ncbi:MAG: permease-like cell division protein FtsX [Clostridia bacterium]|nr:permease-like cell division protein FtsX [Clostridia bacterium]